MDDLDRFVKRRKFYKRVGKAWKRGYLLYGPPGTGKSSLIAAMANYLKFNIYDLELTSLQSNSELRRLLVSTANRSILVIEDIDCSRDFQNREAGGYDQGDSQVSFQVHSHFNVDDESKFSVHLFGIESISSALFLILENIENLFSERKR